MTEMTASFAWARTDGVAGSFSLATGTLDGLDAVQWRRRDAIIHTGRSSPGLLRERLWEVEPIRQGVQYQNRINQHGLYYWPRTGVHVWYESALGLACLVELDHAGEAVRIAAQPFRMLFRRGSAATYHDPDFFAVHASSDQVVYDVKPADRISGRARVQFSETARVCAEVGWRHIVLSESSVTRAINLAFLRSARLTRCHPKDDVFVQLLHVFEPGRSIGEGAAMVNGCHPVLAMPFIKHLIWHRRLGVDLDHAAPGPLGALRVSGLNQRGQA